jgi:hypothetical protein
LFASFERHGIAADDHHQCRELARNLAPVRPSPFLFVHRWIKIRAFRIELNLKGYG